jgi:hypothetical protein
MLLSQQMECSVGEITVESYHIAWVQISRFSRYGKCANLNPSEITLYNNIWYYKNRSARIYARANI